MVSSFSTSKTPSTRECVRSCKLQPLLFLLLISLVGFGTFLRLKGVSSLSLWLDETHVANALCNEGGFAKYFRPPISQRPLLYLIISEWLLTIHNTELFARLTSLIPSLLSLLLIVPLSLRMFTNRAVSILSVFLLAVNPYLIDASKEFKPYVLEHFLCLLMLFFVVCWWRDGKKKYIYYYCLTAVISPLLGNPFLFVLPVFSLLLIYDLYASNTRHLQWLVLASTLVAISWYAVLYYLVVRHIDTSHISTFDKNLYSGGGLWHGLTWTMHHLWSMFSAFVPGKNFLGYDSVLNTIINVMVGGGVIFFGVRVVINHDWRFLALLFFPILLSAIVSIVFKWPFGVARTNIYAISLLTLIVLIGIEYFFSTFQYKVLRYSAVSLFIIIMFPYNVTFYDYKHQYYWTPNEEFVPGVTALMDYYDNNHIYNLSKKTNKQLIIFNSAADSQFKYYTLHHSILSKPYTSFFQNFDIKFINSRDGNAVGKFIAEELTKNDSVIFMFSHYQPQEIQSLLDIVYAPYVTVLFERNFQQTYLVHASFQRR